MIYYLLRLRETSRNVKNTWIFYAKLRNTPRNRLKLFIYQVSEIYADTDEANVDKKTLISALFLKKRIK
jgi:hypothetical protein